MTLISFFTSLINIGTEWYMTAIYAVCLFFEGIVFEGVTLIYNLFLIVCSINLSTVSGLLSSVVERLKALIIVFIVFKLGVSLVGYLLDPDKDTFSKDINKLDTFPDINNKVSSAGTHPYVASEKVIPCSKFFCISRIAIAKGSFGLRPFLDSIISILCNAFIKVKLFRKSDAILREMAIRFSVSVLNTNLA